MYAPDYTPLPGSNRAYPQPERRNKLGEYTLTYQVLFAWFNMSASTRRLITEKPSEPYLLLLLLSTDLAFFMSWTLKAIVVPNLAGVSLISVEIGALFVLAMVGRTVGLYIFAMVLGALCRLCGGRGTWRNTRIAVFWGAFVTAPFGILAALILVLFTNLEASYPIFGADWISMPPYWLGVLPFVWYVSVAVARAQGFRKVSPLFLTMSVVSLVGLIAGMYFHARGMI
ncbi:MAG: hypothetical protein GXP05_03945 [Alphaproteobacteria bacterium]|nr:hypothetical protein [Alphaproteobacteria bacterium]